MLYLVSTPIGNLGDFSFRAIELLKEVDLILCEDTRTSKVLFDRYEIKKPLASFHKFNEKEKESALIARLKNGEKIALVSDAGTPGISDPGEALAKAAIESGIDVQAIPGPSAFLMALQLSGFPTAPFQFVGFLPKKSGELKGALEKILAYEGTSVLYESPHRLLKLLELLPPNRPISISRELTKKFEETLRGAASQLLGHFQTHPPKGEFVVVLSQGKDTLEEAPTLEEAFKALEKQGASKAEIIKSLSQQFRLSKQEIKKVLFTKSP